RSGGEHAVVLHERAPNAERFGEPWRFVERAHPHVERRELRLVVDRKEREIGPDGAIGIGRERGPGEHVRDPIVVEEHLADPQRTAARAGAFVVAREIAAPAERALETDDEGAQAPRSSPFDRSWRGLFSPELDEEALALIED